MPKAYAYTRVSTQEQSQGMSLDGQLHTIAAYAATAGFEVVRAFVDRGATGTDDDRPEFQEMIEALLAPSNSVTAVIVVHTSRFMRDVELARRYKRELRKKGVRVLAVQQATSDDANGELMEGIYELFDQHESRIIGARTRAAMMENARQGYFNGALAPFGFQIERSKLPNGKTKQKLVAHPGEAVVVQEIFSRYLAGSGAKSLAKALTAEGKLHRGCRWSRDSVLKVLGNTAAMGRYRWGVRDSRTGQLRKASHIASSEVVVLVAADTFEAAQALRQKRDPEKKSTEGYTGPLLLGGLMRCGRCGKTMQLETSGKDSGRYRYYNCRTFCRSGASSCAGYRVAEKKLNAAFIQAFVEHALSADRLRQVLTTLAASQSESTQAEAGIRSKLQEQVAILDKKAHLWVTAFEDGVDLTELGPDRLRALRTERAALLAQLQEVRARKPLPPYLFKPLVQARFRQLVETALCSEQRTLARPWLDALVDRAEVIDGDVVVQVRGAALIAQMQKPRSFQKKPSGLAGTSTVRTHVDVWRTP